MKKFALVLVSVLLALSCSNRKTRLLLEVHEVDYRNKSDVTLKGEAIDAEWPMDMQEIAVCDSFLLVKSGDNEHILYVYSDDLKLKGRFGCIGRARNEFLTTTVQWFSAQILRNEQGDAMIPLVDMQQGTKLVDLQKSLAAQSTVIAEQNDFMGRHTVKYIDPEHPRATVVMSCVVRTQFLDDDINHRFGFFTPITEDYKVHTQPVFALTHDTALVKEIKMLSRVESKDAEFTNGFIIKHPSGTLWLMLYTLWIISCSLIWIMTGLLQSISPVHPRMMMTCPLLNRRILRKKTEPYLFPLNAFLISKILPQRNPSLW